MNVFVLAVASVTLLACVAHLFGGTRETAAIEPDVGQPKLVRYWVQALCAFQMLSVDLAVVSGILFAVALMDLGDIERPILLIASAVFALWGIVWVVQLRWLGRDAATLLNLPHWVVWFACSAALLAGSAV